MFICRIAQIVICERKKNSDNVRFALNEMDFKFFLRNNCVCLINSVPHSPYLTHSFSSSSF